MNKGVQMERVKKREGLRGEDMGETGYRTCLVLFHNQVVEIKQLLA